MIQFGVPPNRIDILQSIADDRASTTLDEGVAVNLISLKHLIQNKKAAGRLQDLADAEKLEQYFTEE